MKKSLNINDFLSDMVLRIVLILIALFTDHLEPFKRVIHKDELWLYNNPQTDSYITGNQLKVMLVIVPTIALILNHWWKRNKFDTLIAILTITLIISLNGVITNLIKLMVGRPRPDFIHRCWPGRDKKPETGSYIEDDYDCTGDWKVIIEGRKSFPSGHSSHSFALFVFLFLFFSAKFKTFSSLRSYANSSLVLVINISLLLIPTFIAISRTCDYHHHWQDVLCGSLLGIVISSLVYFHYYPWITSERSEYPRIDFKEDGYGIRGV